MSDKYEPYDPDYCKEIDCQYRHGNKCDVPECADPKRIRWWSKYKKPKKKVEKKRI